MAGSVLTAIQVDLRVHAHRDIAKGRACEVHQGSEPMELLQLGQADRDAREARICDGWRAGQEGIQRSRGNIFHLLYVQRLHGGKRNWSRRKGRQGARHPWKSPTMH